jgi:hypothetical protein
VVHNVDSEYEMDATCKSLIEHWNWAAEKGLMNRNTAASLKAACAAVVGSIDGLADLDVGRLDVDDTLKRFVNLKRREFAPRTLGEYERRFRYAVTSYRAFLHDPGTWDGKSRRRRAREEPARLSAEVATPVHPGLSSEPLSNRSEKMIDYPYPLRDGYTARILVPRDLTLAEVRKLSGFLATLCSDYDPSNQSQRRE